LTFSKFFEDKLQCICATIASAMQSYAYCIFAPIQNPGAVFARFRIVYIEEVPRVLTTMPSKKSSLPDVVPDEVLS
jgi:hypothetical protein